jgi:hypothetical protein
MRIKVKRICKLCEREFTGTLKSKWCCNACKQAAYRLRILARDPGNVTNPMTRRQPHANKQT